MHKWTTDAEFEMIRNQNNNEYNDKWTEEDIHNLVMEEVGEDLVFPVGFQIFGKIYVPPEVYDSGISRTEHARRNERITSCVAKVLRMGPECYADSIRFPLGARVKYGQWYLFKSTQRQLLSVKSDQFLETFCGMFNDDGLMSFVKDPTKVVTSFDLEYEHTGS